MSEQSRASMIESLFAEVHGPRSPSEGSPHLTPDGDLPRTSDPNIGIDLHFWRPEAGAASEELLCKERPATKYGVGILHPRTSPQSTTNGEVAAQEPDALDTAEEPPEQADANYELADGEFEDIVSDDEDEEIVSPDAFRPDSVGISFCLAPDEEGSIEFSVPPQFQRPWQSTDADPSRTNGIYRRKTVLHTRANREEKFNCWARHPATDDRSTVTFSLKELRANLKLRAAIPLTAPTPKGLELVVECWTREAKVANERVTIVTAFLRNCSQPTTSGDRTEYILFQGLLLARMVGGARLRPYPSEDGFSATVSTSADERSLALLYRNEHTWAIGHGCAAGWARNDSPSAPQAIFTDSFPACELPSVTPDVTDERGNRLEVRMHDLWKLPDSDLQQSEGWRQLVELTDAYGRWIDALDPRTVETKFRETAEMHKRKCLDWLGRMRAGLETLNSEPLALRAFRLANQAMLLQQIATKLNPRTTEDRGAADRCPMKRLDSWDGQAHPMIGRWRPFQAAFLLASISGMWDPSHDDRTKADVIWFPTGGGKTEAYLVVAAFAIFLRRLRGNQWDLKCDGTAVFMRYTLRMLTAQQFQRASALACAMEHIRRSEKLDGGGISVGLWVGDEATPNKRERAREKVRKFKERPHYFGNPLVSERCAWCGRAIGAFNGELHGIYRYGVNDRDGPRVRCPDPSCAFGREGAWLPIEVIDENIYERPPTFVIATADKFAMMAWRPEAGSLFGIKHSPAAAPKRSNLPPTLILQDELHLISGPLGTIYGIYECAIDGLCTAQAEHRPKIIASSATVRDVSTQTHLLYGDRQAEVFPSPGLSMADSFFGRYDRCVTSQKLAPGRLYLGIHATSWSPKTAQVRSAATLLHAAQKIDHSARDPWMTLMGFYNSLRELGGAHTLFADDVKKRLYFLYRRDRAGESCLPRQLRTKIELSSRGKQSQLVEYMSQLALPASRPEGIDVCLASNIIEVGIDIERLSLMMVVGQPKSTSTYIQATGRVGRNPREAPGLVVTLLSPTKSRDRSHFEQFNTFHRRLYERVEPSSVTPHASQALRWAAIGAILLHARQHSPPGTPDPARHRSQIRSATEQLRSRLDEALSSAGVPAEARALAGTVIDEQSASLLRKMDNGGFPHAEWERFPPASDGDYLLLWPGQKYSDSQRNRGCEIPTTLRNVDVGTRIAIRDVYSPPQPNPLESRDA
jgi:hypothetical protein